MLRQCYIIFEIIKKLTIEYKILLLGKLKLYSHFYITKGMTKYAFYFFIIHKLNDNCMEAIKLILWKLIAAVAINPFSTAVLTDSLFFMKK